MCSVPTCMGNYANGPKVSVFSFPKDQSLKWKWIRAIHRQNFVATDDSKNGMFIGPTLTVPFMLLAVYSMGAGTATVPIYMKIFMYMSYLRYGLEGIIAATYSNGRPAFICPHEEDMCMFQHPKELLNFMGMEDANVWVAITGLVVCTFFFRALCYLLLRLRLSPHHSLRTVRVIGQFLKTRYIAQQFR